VLEIAGLTVHYGGIEAVRGIDIAVNEGEIVALLGANGAGKSSTLRGVAGLIDSSGDVRWQGRTISAWPAFKRARLGLALVPEGRRVFGTLTVEENLLIGAYTQRSKAKLRAGVDAAYAMFPRLEERKTSPAGLLSGGEQQMLAFGRAMMAEPKVILMDEPSMGLAPAVVDLVFQAVADIAATGVGILLVEQNAVVSLEVADRAAVLERGRIVLEGDAVDMREDPGVLRAFLGSESAAASSEL